MIPAGILPGRAANADKPVKPTSVTAARAGSVGTDAGPALETPIAFP